MPYLCTRNQISKVWLRAFFVYRNPVPFLKLKFGEYLAVQLINIIYKYGRKSLCVLSSAVWRIESGAQRRWIVLCIEDLVAITDIGRDKLFPVLADTEGKVVEIYVEAETKKVPKDFKPRLFSVNSLAMLTR